MSQPPTFHTDAELVAALRRGDEEAFRTLFEKYHAGLVRLAMSYVSNRAAAEDVAQETWLGVLNGLDRFEGRSSLKTWIFTILINRAKTRGQRESRSLPFSALGDADSDPDEPAVDPDRFISPPDSTHRGGHWASSPHTFPEAQALTSETGSVIRNSIAALPPTQRQVITLRDVDGFSADEVCNILEISETNQRVLLHRARAKVRRALEKYFAEGKS
ncbi:MAG TPA: sigma-70 family RNA polymerase sigma factor [Anaerolineales bacterium]|nr:sigma-70 family RNA polymerase sigma factor [Anaerolineales bacterium]